MGEGADLNAGIDGRPGVDKQFLSQAHKLGLLGAVEERHKLCTGMRARCVFGPRGRSRLLVEDLPPFRWAGGPFSLVVLAKDKCGLEVDVSNGWVLQTLE